MRCRLQLGLTSGQFTLPKAVRDALGLEEGERVAGLVRAIIAFPTVGVLDAVLLLALEVYETDWLDFAEAYLGAQAERSGVGMPRSHPPPA